jgi:hypothetical protein
MHLYIFTFVRVNSLHTKSLFIFKPSEKRSKKKEIFQINMRREEAHF